MIVTNGKIYDVCGYCNSLVRINKPLVGSLHVCVSPQERDETDKCEAMKEMQINNSIPFSCQLGSTFITDSVKKYLGIK